MHGTGRKSAGIGEALAFAGWMLAALAARWPLVGRIEGILDHDQAVVGLMAQDIAAGRRWPIFFDGQRYMGAVEPYVSAGFVRALGREPSTVAMAPWLFFGLLAGLQFLAWNRWRGAKTGHLAALLTVTGSPFFAAWSIVPRGGYIELLAWMVPAIAAYRLMTWRSADPPGFGRQFGWGMMLTLGGFLNPLAWITYAALLADWTFGRHGRDLRESWKIRPGGWLDRPWAPAAWLAMAGSVVLILGACVHVNFEVSQGSVGIVYGLRVLPKPVAVLGALGLLGGLAWAAGLGRRAWTLLAKSPGFAAGAMLVQVPMLAYQGRVALGWAEREPSLPTWIRAPWRADWSPIHLAQVADFVAGCRPRAAVSPLFGQAVPFPEPAWPGVAGFLDGASPFFTALVIAVLATVALRDRFAWKRFWSLRGRDPSRPTLILTLLIAGAFGLYRIQGSSFDGSSVRYLLPAWAALPGLLAVGLRLWPAWPRGIALGILLGGWGLAQANLWADAGRECPFRPLVRDLENQGVTGIVAQTPAALLVADLSGGRVGSMAYQGDWPRLGLRYADRIPPEGPVVCVVDTAFPWPTPEHPGWPPNQDLGRHLAELGQRYPGRVGLLGRVGSFEIWRADLPREEVLAAPEALAEADPSGYFPGTPGAGSKTSTPLSQRKLP
ncbi:MAG: hypothetical protein U0800_27725 [Isosphaeraceae bacterium]